MQIENMKPVEAEYYEQPNPARQIQRKATVKDDDEDRDIEIEVDDTYQQLYAESVARPSVISESLYSMIQPSSGASGETICLNIYFFETQD